MIPLPQRPIAGLSTLPWLSLGFLLLTLGLLLGWQGLRDDDERALQAWYSDSGLLALEQPAYLSWLRLHGQVDKAWAVERDPVDEQGRHSLWHFRQLAFDPAFAAHNRATAAGQDIPYWHGAELTRWQQLRDQFEHRAATLPRQRAGLNPADTRPATLLTVHFTSNGLLGWLLCALVLLPFAWALEGTLGWRRLLMLWPLSAVLAGALSGILLRPDHQLLLGGQVMVSAAVGMYLGLFGRERLRFLLPGRNQTPEWPAWLLLPFWLVLPATAPMLGQSWLPPVLGLLCGAALVQLARMPDMSLFEEQDSEDDPGERDSLRHHLTGGWAALGSMQFRDAEQHFLAAVRLAPTHFNALCGLYQVRKLRPQEVDFLATASRLLTLPLVDDGERRQQHALWREAQQLCGDALRLNTAARLQLARQFASVDALDDAEALLHALPEDAHPHAVIAAQRALGEGFTRRGNHNKARHYLARADAVTD